MPLCLHTSKLVSLATVFSYCHLTHTLTLSKGMSQLAISLISLQSILFQAVIFSESLLFGKLISCSAVPVYILLVL